ncbi:hypothetical protein MC7420_3492 [Coleofasciculus chthonoplastes PCC 7420]|uniref:Uncharacterized protein n=2 Tax=Coleofasciculus chthonoplastes TaxID=64178 RepID=B4W089_9CYAN|nr:hypothetical protein MC7420_3492 [Coleofasciculus chthonoplastes PCC 7420]
MIPEVALTMSDRVTSLHSTLDQNTSGTSPDQLIPEDSNTEIHDEIHNTQAIQMKRLQLSQQLMHLHTG